MAGDDDVGAGEHDLLGQDLALGGEHPAVDHIGAAVDDAERATRDR